MKLFIVLILSCLLNFHSAAQNLTDFVGCYSIKEIASENRVVYSSKVDTSHIAERFSLFINPDSSFISNTAFYDRYSRITIHNADTGQVYFHLNHLFLRSKNSTKIFTYTVVGKTVELKSKERSYTIFIKD